MELVLYEQQTGHAGMHPSALEIRRRVQQRRQARLNDEALVVAKGTNGEVAARTRKYVDCTISSVTRAQRMLSFVKNGYLVVAQRGRVQVAACRSAVYYRKVEGGRLVLPASRPPARDPQSHPLPWQRRCAVHQPEQTKAGRVKRPGRTDPTASSWPAESTCELAACSCGSG